MKLATFTHDDTTRVGVVVDTDVIDLAAAAPELPREMTAFLRAGDAALASARDAMARGEHALPLSQAKLEAPVRCPQKFLGAGLNYGDHIQETGMEAPKFPTFFNKQSSCVNAPYDPIHLPRASTFLDYEGELAIVIGRRCRHVPRERAHEVIAGYTIVDDVSVRDWQRRAVTMTLGKSWDTHGPMGPWIVTADEIGDPHALDLKTWVNGDLRQNSNTKHLIFDCFQQIETLSTVCTLEPGDVIATGTPSGVGVAMDPRSFLVAGDVVRIEVQGIGHIEHRVIDEPEDTPLI